MKRNANEKEDEMCTRKENAGWRWRLRIHFFHLVSNFPFPFLISCLLSFILQLDFCLAAASKLISQPLFPFSTLTPRSPRVFLSGHRVLFGLGLSRRVLSLWRRLVPSLDSKLCSCRSLAGSPARALDYQELSFSHSRSGTLAVDQPAQTRAAGN